MIRNTIHNISSQLKRNYYDKKYSHIKGFTHVDLTHAKVFSSKIHGKGMLANHDIKTDTHIIQYVGEIVTKKESDKRSDRDLVNNYKDAEHGAVYIFTLNKRYDIDGNVAWNPARFINHACDPNCEAINVAGEIWISAKRFIKKGEELTYNYGYDIDNYKDHECKCGSHNCIGYIASEEHWPKLRRLLKKNSAKE